MAGPRHRREDTKTRHVKAQDIATLEQQKARSQRQYLAGDTVIVAAARCGTPRVIAVEEAEAGEDRDLRKGRRRRKRARRLT